MDKEQITESTPTVCKFFRAAAVPILVFLVIYGFFFAVRLAPLPKYDRINGANDTCIQPVPYRHPCRL